MPRLMYDSTNPRSIPKSALMVAGYIDGSVSKWPAEAWNWWPNAKMIRISAVGSTWDADVFDVEPGAIWPPENVVPLVLESRSHGRNPSVYVNEQNHWSYTRNLFRDRGLAEPPWWVANYNGRREIPAGSVGRQYAHPSAPLGNPNGLPWHTAGHWDESWMADYWPGVDEEKPMDWDTFKSFMERWETFHGRFGGPEPVASNGPSRRETFQTLLEHAQKKQDPAPVALTPEQVAEIRNGLAAEVADLLAERMRD